MLRDHKGKLQVLLECASSLKFSLAFNKAFYTILLLNVVVSWLVRISNDAEKLPPRPEKRRGFKVLKVCLPSRTHFRPARGQASRGRIRKQGFPIPYSERRQGVSALDETRSGPRLKGSRGHRNTELLAYHQIIL